jgi:ribonuclease HI
MMGRLRKEPPLFLTQRFYTNDREARFFRQLNNFSPGFTGLPQATADIARIRPHRLKIYFDGGCRPNPGAIEIAVVARGHAYVSRDHGYGTSNDAEWLALIEAVRIALSLGESGFVLIGDSATVVNQANGLWKCRRADRQNHLQTFHDLTRSMGKVQIRQVKRSQNLAGIALARKPLKPGP